MLEIPRLIGTPRANSGIVVQTRKGRSIRNFHGPEPSPQCHNKFKILCEKFGKSWSLRKGPTGGYNCAGMVWACRRVVLSEPEDWQSILDDDGYRQLRSGEQPVLGDIVVYFKDGGPDNEILHIARICGTKRLVLDSQGSESKTEIAMALSKWDLSSGESVHAIRDVFLNGGEAFIPVIYTDRN